MQLELILTGWSRNAWQVGRIKSFNVSLELSLEVSIKPKAVDQVSAEVVASTGTGTGTIAVVVGRSARALAGGSNHLPKPGNCSGVCGVVLLGQLLGLAQCGDIGAEGAYTCIW